ncbi:MAG TPA: pitrilysin family protein [Candidatus Lokiarchaeia archaeon]|nr:pitrilysin family protein [Candidatus Lokiarchaeia archaeon]
MDLNFLKLDTESSSPLWIFPQQNANSVAFGVLIFAGTRDEIWPKEAGIAHALEHMHFQGTEKFPSSVKVSSYIEDVGGRVNAYTSKEMTFYHLHLPVEYAKRGVEILSQQIQASIFPEEKIGTEMNNIIQEIRRRNDIPRSHVFALHNELIYGKHPLGRDTLGTEESVANFGRGDFFSFKERYYNSSNMVFLAAGNIGDIEAVDLFDEFFPFVPGEKNERKIEEGSGFSARSQIEKRDITQVHLVMSAVIESAALVDSSALELFNYMVSGGMSFPLFQEVRDKRGLCYEINAGLAKWSDFSNFNIYVGTDPNRYNEAIKATLDVLEDSKSDTALLERAKALRIGRMALNFENMLNVIDIAANDITFLGAPRGYEQVTSEIEKVTIDDVEKSVSNYLSNDRISTTMLVPQGLEKY